jgi:hypothetical protein
MLATLDLLYIRAGSSTMNNHDKSQPKRKKSGGPLALVIEFCTFDWIDNPPFSPELPPRLGQFIGASCRFRERNALDIRLSIALIAASR